MKTQIRLASLFHANRFVAALVLGASMFSAAPALAHGSPAAHNGPTPASAKLPIVRPTMTVHSWNGRPITVVTPSPANTRFPNRGLDPMNVQVTGLHRDSEMEFMRQKQSHDVEISGTHNNQTAEQLLKAAATQAAHYVTMFKFKSQAPSAAQAHNELVTNEQHVAWPNSRVLLRGRTRPSDGQDIPHVTAVVDGTPDTRTQPYDASTRSVANVLISGRFLPSARAWIKAGNLFVSEPTKDLKAVSDGDALLKSADAKDKLIADKQEAIAAENLNRQQGKAYDQQKINSLTAEIQKLQGESATERQQGNALVTRGNKIMVRVISAGGLPASAPVTTVSTRVRGEGTQGLVHTDRTTTDEYDGYTRHEVEALHLDHLETTVTFGTPGSNNGRSKSSTATLRYQVPAQSAKADFVVHGAKFYRVTPTSSSTSHEIADAI